MSSCNRRNSQRGHAVLEFALAWPLLWLLFAGTYQYGYDFYVYNRLMSAVTNAAELGSKINYDTANTSAYTTALQNMVVYGDETAGNSPIVTGLTTSNVSVNVTLGTGSVIPLDVTVSITGYTVKSLFSKVSLSGKPRVTMKYLGQAVCSTC